MLRKMMLLALSASALVAFAAAAVAHAEVRLTNSDGTAVATETEITATSFNHETVTAAGTLFCAKTTLHGTVVVNSAPHVTVASIAITTEGCKITGVNIPVTITDPTWGTITIGTEGGSALTTFIDDIGPPFNVMCHFEGTVGFTFESGTDILTIPGSKVTKGAGFQGCPTEGLTQGSYTLENAAGPVTIEKTI